MIKEELKSLLLSLKEEDYCKDVDLHIHSNESDGKMAPVEIIQQAKDRNMRYISIADHNNIDAYLSTNILREEIIIPSVEFDCFYKGVLIHILGYGINIDDKGLESLYANSKIGRTCNIYRLFKLRHPKDVIEKIKKAGGISVLAHPACYWAWNLESFVKNLIDFGLEGLEVYYQYKGLRSIVKFHSIKKVKEIAEKYDLIKTGGSDSHGKEIL